LVLECIRRVAVEFAVGERSVVDDLVLCQDDLFGSTEYRVFEIVLDISDESGVDGFRNGEKAIRRAVGVADDSLRGAMGVRGNVAR